MRERRRESKSNKTRQAHIKLVGFTLIFDMAEEPRRGPPVVEIVLPSYITKPAEDEKFYPSEAKAVAEKVSKRG